MSRLSVRSRAALVLGLLLLLCGARAAAQPAAPAVAAPLAPYDDTLILQPLPPLQQRPDIGRPSGAGAAGQAGLPQVSDEDLRGNLSLAERVINQAMLNEDWQVLGRLMDFYPAMAGADPILADYVLGALARHEGRHAEAIRRYRAILARQPDLSYVRLDLGAMLFENKAYREADDEFAAVLRDMRMVQGARTSAMAYRHLLAQRLAWEGAYAVGYGWTSNVNSATDNRFFYMPVDIDENGVLYLWEMEKDGKDLPHSGHGPAWSVQAGREFNLAGNHFLGVQASSHGTLYGRQSDYNEFAANFRLGYKYQDIDSWFGVTPHLGKLWLGGKSYSDSHGISLDYGRWLTGRWQVSGAYTWMERRYQDSRYRGYEGKLRSVSMNVLHVWSPASILFAGLAWQDEDARSGEASSVRRSVQVGAFRQFGQGVQARASLRYTRRRFDAPYSLFLWQDRRDREYQADVSLWQRDWQVLGMTPRLDLSYLRVKSNLYAYPRSEKTATLWLERAF
ncbi:surface lipoprotein assembly modifier [Kerstersia sp.]|uniref:surface lipoprotein assembly modifier n=1 Tax=Kerstersia sp. TaxID=1930783 RepID=UPI003F8F632D